MAREAVVTCFLRNGGEVLLLRRADDASTYPGKWGAVSGYVEHDDPLETARMEIREETRLTDTELVRAGETFGLRDDELGREWTIHPYLFEAGSREVRLNEETAVSEWTTPTAILRRETVPELWSSYDRVRPRPETIAADDEHGSASLSIHALEVLRDEAGHAAVAGDDVEALWPVAETLLDARPSMAAIRNRVNRVMSGTETPSDVERAALDGIALAVRADEEAATAVADVIEGKRVLTLSRSGTVSTALRSAEPEVVIAESRPAREGVDVAERLATDGLDVTVCTDASVAHILARGSVNAVVVGADTILPDGRVVNKTGTRGTAIAAEREGVPVYAVAASDKISHRNDPTLESGPREAVYAGDADVDVVNPTFDVTPSETVDGVFTERGRLDEDDVREVADEHRERAAWRETTE